ncbi:MAG TPA: M67 family metallopeptidase [Rhizomicrobium sp.]|jgi:proteasome lid subunit RPN8/RPN11|nr:M67 family metallopeptidase [Rhizomicrobium sp.]
MIDRLALPSALSVQILRAARAAAPQECCGLIEGIRRGKDARATALYPAHNLSPHVGRFEIDPQDHFDALRGARARGQAIIGCYHSHPHGQAKPSQTDLAGAGEEDFLWLIAAGGRLAAFVYSRGGFSVVATGADLVTSSS